ncbi:Twitching motility protein PilT [Cystobacter fuscus DSM 2262]|uniref:Twitching motility protein PilT n=1 Tax=Cystobacter fuscus (strain ATCC 25194 / DSM 2262 / NBRC 100088 / M29) TaxID=1242864 RepID=S9P023_CYSF2|nr:type IV pilus twitching motility protein PilT [Cystobacter fuscus]EPX56471.1 Twitching motility protein PilT [Cystobacter fuscus DSM 2262]
MARFDAFIDKLYKESAVAIMLETGSGITLRTASGNVPMVKAGLNSQQIIGALSEIVPADLRANFPPEGVSSFPYSAPAGSVQVKVQNVSGHLKVALVPYKAPAPAANTVVAAPSAPAALELPPSSGEEKLELASPADMMDLAARGSGGAFTSPPPAAAKAPAAKAPTPAPAAPEPSNIKVLPVEVDPDAHKTLLGLLNRMLDKKASDLHMSSQVVPMLRIDGDMVAQDDYRELSHDRLKAMLWSIAPEKNKKQWEETRDTDFAYETDRARFRVNVFEDRKGIGSVMRQIPTKIMTAEDMGLSKHILDLCFLSKGLVLVTGPTGSGKSTTLAAMIDYINRNREDHIITIEDPIEFVHPNKKCLVNQREVHVHTHGFKNALRAALREDPDIVLVGEMRDLETIAIAIETAETGHLVFGTLHTNTAPSTVDRIIDQFPADRQEQIRMMLSESLKGVISQMLVKKIGGGRVPAQEVLLCTSSVANLIREGKTFQIPSIMQTSRGIGMSTLNDSLFDLVKRKLCEPNDAYIKAVAKGEFKQMLERAGYKLDLPTS